MIKAQLPEYETQRLVALDKYEVLDTDAEKVFDDLTELASAICETPISLVSLIDRNRQWFKSKVGLVADEIPRDIAFCSHAILTDDIFEIEDALEDERFCDNPLVTGPPHIRFYAGTQLTTPEGFNIGTLCVISDQPKTLNEQQKKFLRTLGSEVISHLERNYLEKSLALANKYKTEFLSNISHEIRTPLNAIIGFSELTLKHNTVQHVSPEIQLYLQHINDSSSRLLSIIDSILDLGKIETGKMELEEVVCDIGKLVAKTVNLLTLKADNENITFSTELEPNTPLYVQIDEQKLYQILVNIISTAIKVTPENNTIDVKLMREKQSFHISIIDRGIGINTEYLNLLYNKYAQVGVKKSTQEGSGIGLSIAKGLVELMEGNINVTNTENLGTTITLTFPLKLHESFQPRAPKIGQQSIPANSRALVVEDNRINQAVISAMLKKLNISFDMVEDGEKALKIIKDTEYNVILMDINLPGIDGIQTTKEIHKLDVNTPVIALTADIYRSKQEKALFQSFLTKPVKLAKLEYEIAATLSAHK